MTPISKQRIYMTVVSVILSTMITSPMFTVTANAATTGSGTVPYFPPTPKLSKTQLNTLIGLAMSVPGIQKWSSSGWQYAYTDFSGPTNPAEWTTAIVHLHLPLGKGNPPIQCTASNGSWASVVINLKTLAIQKAEFPVVGMHYSCTNPHNAPVSLGAPVSASGNPNTLASVNPLTAISKPSYVIAEENDVTSNTVIGSWANIYTPSFTSPGVYSNMDNSISLLINQKWTTGDLTQLGWTITTASGCSGTGINSDSADLGYVDTSTNSNYCIYNISTYTYTAGQNMFSQTVCNGGTDYVMQAQYGGTNWSHTTAIPCSTASQDSNDYLNNSVFFENDNTVSSSGWAGDITGTTQASSANEEIGSNIQHWSTSNNQVVYYSNSCTTRNQVNTNIISGSLASNGIAKWTGLSSTQPAC
ncbi:MAG: hypothetical protein KGL95_06420 [Patescibacteria group bacterium]|nr:hypothetical protein [Patescibacteria group bacterium]